MKAVIFTRVSSLGQGDGMSLDAQEAKLLDYCREKNEISQKIQLLFLIFHNVYPSLRSVYHPAQGANFEILHGLVPI